MLDDTGFAQLGCYGAVDRDAEHRPPRRERACRYNNFHTTAMCSPTRASLLTGRNHHSVGVGAIMEMATGFPGYDCEMPRARGHRRRHPAVGVATTPGRSASGTWFPTGSARSSAPTTPGRSAWASSGTTDSWVPTPTSSPHAYRDNHARRDARRVGRRRLPRVGRPDRRGHRARHRPDRGRSDQTVLLLRRVRRDAMRRTRRRAVTSTSTPVDSTTAGTSSANASSSARSRCGDRSPREPSWPRSTAACRPWDDLSADERRLFARMHEVYAGFLEHTDAQIGRLIDALEAAGRLDNTVVHRAVRQRCERPRATPTGDSTR